MTNRSTRFPAEKMFGTQEMSAQYELSVYFVVDDGSTDGTCEWLQAQDDIVFLRQDEGKHREMLVGSLGQNASRN